MKTVKVVAAIIRDGDRIFATQRGYGEFKDGWEFPGGKIEAGETPREALVREIREELDTEIEAGELFDTVEYDYPDFHLSMECYFCKVLSGALTLLEHEAARWLTKETLFDVDWLPADRDLIEKLKSVLEKEDTNMTLTDTAARFIKYARILTPSCEGSGTSPSSSCQFDLAKVLADEMKEMGIRDARVDGHCYVYGSIPATPGCEDRPVLGFIAHMDTVSDFADHNPCPVVTEDYDGGDMVLGDSGRVLKVSDFPHLPSLKGRTLITTDGTTVLGADDKAGVAEIMTMAERLLGGDIPHGKICIGFTPDEEIGAGVAHFDVGGFGADYAYTVDGGPEGSIEYENFNAAGAMFEVHGFNVHPGEAKDIMINAALVAMEIDGMLPAGQTPRDTSGYEGFYHLVHMEGAVDTARLVYIVRDHDAELFDGRLDTLRRIEAHLNEKYGPGTVQLQIKEQYRNMAEQIKPCFHLIENGMEAIREAGLEPMVEPIRGGTDGALLSYMGLPCPNLGTGGYAFHGPYEHITVEGMEKAVEILINIVRKYE